MALLFCDSFDHYAIADRLQKWSAAIGTNTPTMPGGNGRHGTASLNCQNTTGNAGNRKQLPGNYSRLIVGVAFYFNAVPNTSHQFLRLLDSGTVQMQLFIRSDGRIDMRTGGGSSVGISSDILSAGNYYYVELDVTFHNTTGSAELRINGVSTGTPYSGSTRSSGNNYANQLDLMGGSGANATPVRFDDLYVCDDSGSVNNSFLGDVRVQALLPNGNGNSSQLLGSDGNSTNNYLLVDEAAPNGDTDYVQGSTVGEKDTYAFADLEPGSGTVYGLQLLQWARKTDAGARSIASVARHSGNEEDSADATLTTTYTYHADIRETKPGGGAWSVSDVNGAEFGTKVTV